MDEEESCAPKRRVSDEVKKERRTEKMLTLAALKVPFSDIAKVVEMPESTVRYQIGCFSEVFEELPNVRNYEEAKSDLLKATQLTLLKNGLSNSKLEKASMLACFQAFEIANKAERLENDKSTENVSHKVLGRISLGIDRS
jgi:hypothetical protein